MSFVIYLPQKSLCSGLMERRSIAIFNNIVMSSFSIIFDDVIYAVLSTYKNWVLPNYMQMYRVMLFHIHLPKLDKEKG